MGGEGEERGGEGRREGRGGGGGGGKGRGGRRGIKGGGMHLFFLLGRGNGMHKQCTCFSFAISDAL